MISLIDALTIQANPAQVTTYGPVEGKYGFEIYSIIREKYRPHFTSNPLYDSEDIAKEKGKESLGILKNLDLDKQRQELANKFGPAGPIVGEIIDASKE